MQKFIRSISALLVLACFSMVTQALTLSAVQSRKMHAGSPRDIPIDFTRSVSGAVTVEPREMGAGHEIVFQFDAPITGVGGVLVMDEDGRAFPASAPSVNGSEVSTIFTLPADAKRVTVRLTSVNGTPGLDFSAAMGFLIGDTNSSGSVSAADTAQVKSRAGRAVSAGNGNLDAGLDFNKSGFITAADISAVKARQTRVLPPAYTVGGTVSGLAGTLVLRLNSDNLYITGNGAFTFPGAATGQFNIVILQQPAGQLCSLTNDSGFIVNASVSTVAVSCVTAVATTIYDIKKGLIAPGTAVRLTNQLVTSDQLVDAGFFMQVKPFDPGYTDAFFSGIFVLARDPSLTVVKGNRVDVIGTVVNFGGQILLDAASVTVVNAFVAALPPATPVASADIATGGGLVAMLDGVLVQVSNVQVIGRNVPENEFTVTGGLIVDDILYAINPMPSQGAVISSLTGTLSTFDNTSKLLPASAADITFPTVTFGPSLTYIRVGDTNANSFPVALTLSLGAPAFVMTFVPISVSDPNSLTVQDGGVSIPVGQSSAVVKLTGVSQSAAVGLSLTLNSQLYTSSVRVIGAAEQPVLTTFTPQAPVITTGGSVTFTVALSIPAPPGGTVVSLALTPPGAGSLPPTVTVPAGAVSASFSYTDLGNVSSATISATLGGTTLNAGITVNVANTSRFAINEVDYDQVVTDTASFIELYNGTSSPINLTGLALVLINGASNSEYARYDLGPAGTLAPGQYLVVGNSTVVTGLPGTVKTINVGSADFIQNGAPDAIALINTTTQTVIDSFSYEGAITAAIITGFAGPVNLVKGRVLPIGTADSNTANGSLCRLPNGTSTDDDEADWRFCAVPTPGAANGP